MHHFDDVTQTYDPDTKSFDNSGYTPVDSEPGSHPDHEDEREPFGWNGGADLGLLVLRLALGGTFAAHGLQKVFGLFGGPGIDGFARFLEQSGFRQARILAWVTGVTELSGGALLVLGLFTPLAAAGVLGVVVNAVVLKWGNGFFGPKGFELEAVLAAMAFAALFAGPGRVALDYGRSWFRHPVVSGFVFLLIAAGASAGVFFGLR